MTPRQPLSPMTVHALVVSALSCLLAFMLMPMLIDRLWSGELDVLPAATAAYRKYRWLIFLLPVIAALVAMAEQRLPQHDRRRPMLWLAIFVVNGAALASIGWLVIAVYVLILPPF